MSQHGSYDLDAYGEMVLDANRIEAYHSALKRFISSDSIVVDLGAGTGILSLLACKLGAKHVFAIESNPLSSAISQLARENGFQDKITVFAKASFEVELPERADILVSSLHGVLPFFRQFISSIVDARNRFLKPDGVLIPSEENIYAVPVESTDAYSRVAHPWQDGPFGLQLDSLSNFASNMMTRLSGSELLKVLSEPQHICRLDHAHFASSDLKFSTDFTATLDGVLHGFCLWNDCTTCEGSTIYNGLEEQRISFGRAFFPLESPLEVMKGDILQFQIEARHLSDRYVWNWTVSAKDKSFEHSGFRSHPLNMEDVLTKSEDFSPGLNLKGQALKHLLSLCNHERSNKQLTEDLIAKFPEFFADERAALQFVTAHLDGLLLD